MAHYHPKRLLLSGPVVFDPEGPELQPHERDMIAHPAVGGVILFAHNFEERQQVADLIRCCREARQGELVVMVDQEGGRVQRFRDGFSALPRAAVLGQAYDFDKKRALAAAEDLGWLCGYELRQVGVDLNLAPVADLQSESTVIGERAYHADPFVAAELTCAAVRGLHRAGVAATAKHFPGHGGVVEDTHESDACDERELGEIRDKDMRVFAALVEAEIDAMMPAHVVYPAVDDCPAGYSAAWIGTHLREELAFAGAVLSDDLSMAAAGVAGEAPERARAALQAGCDLALVCQRPLEAEAVIDDLSAEPIDTDRAARTLALRRDAESYDERTLQERSQQLLSWLQQPLPERE